MSYKLGIKVVKLESELVKNVILEVGIQSWSYEIASSSCGYWNYKFWGEIVSFEMQVLRLQVLQVLKDC